MISIKEIVSYVSLVFSLIGVYSSARVAQRLWRLRNLRKILGIRSGDHVLIVCSELPDPIERQMVEPREYIYLMKYGDLDAWVECILSMVKMFPKTSLHILSSGEALQSTMDLDGHICLIGGPDYNKMTEYLMNMGLTRLIYTEIEGEIAIQDKKTGKNYFYTTLDKDFGYIEKIRSPYNPNKYVLLFGGCHTVGVTSAVKFLSAYSNGRSVVSDIAIINAKRLVDDPRIDLESFVILINASKVGATISYPTSDNIVDMERV